jgi:dienelactone hydrolase
LRDERAGHRWSAGRKYQRACAYFFTAERMTSHESPQKLALYAAMTRCFEKSVTLRDEPIEFVTLPYEGTTLPALLYRAPQAGPRPAMIHFDGFDVTKEWIHLCGIAREFAVRGISTLIVDHPGVGAALRLQHLAVNLDSERWARAALDWLQQRPEIDSRRVGVIAMSLGGYYAPRAAAFEPRLACCVAWGARWDNDGSHGQMLRDPNASRSVTGWIDHALWYYGAADVAEAAGDDRADEARRCHRARHVSAAGRAWRARPPGAARAGAAYRAGRDEQSPRRTAAVRRRRRWRRALQR